MLTPRALAGSVVPCPTVPPLESCGTALGTNGRFAAGNARSTVILILPTVEELLLSLVFVLLLLLVFVFVLLFSFTFTFTFVLSISTVAVASAFALALRLLL